MDGLSGAAAVRVQIVSDARALYRAGAREFEACAREAVRVRGRFMVALSGGSTPKGLFALLAGDHARRHSIPWDRCHVFWGDERHVPPDHAESNFRMADETLLSKVGVPAANVHRMRGELEDAAQAAAEYEDVLRKAFHLEPGEFPRFDLALLGLGADAHTASLFPGTSALKETRRLAVANWVPKLNAHRITLTIPVLDHAAKIVFLVSGQEKARALKDVLEGERDPEQAPARLIRPQDGELLWLVDRAAAWLLENRRGPS